MSYYIITEENIFEYIQSVPQLVSIVGEDKSSWTVSEIGDGNVNYIYLVTGSNGSFVLKQAPPFIRIAPGWALTSDRIYYEYAWFEEAAKYAQEFLPEILYFNREMSVLVESFLTPDVILRGGMIQGIEYPLFAEHISSFLAETLFHTSDLFLKAEQKKRLVDTFNANVLIHITESVIFSEPFCDHPNNKHDELIDDAATAIKQDVELKLHVATLKNRFMNSAEALLHADLHTGSIMLSQQTTYVIDSEFTSYGPMGFDTGLLVGNMFLCYYSQEGRPNISDTYGEWILKTVVEIWNGFKVKLCALWDEKPTGELYNYFSDDENERKLVQEHYFDLVFSDTLGYAGIAMIRRILGMAHVADIDSIEDAEVRAKVQRKALNFGRYLVLNRNNIKTIEEVVAQL